MESNRYRVERIIEQVPQEIRPVVEGYLRGELMRGMEDVLFSGNWVAVKIEREEETRYLEGLRVRYTANVQQIPQVVHTYSAIMQYPKRKKSKKQRIAEKRAALKRNRERKAALRKRVRT